MILADEFQSSPNPQTGCDRAGTSQAGQPSGFNPHPILRLGATPENHIRRPTTGNVSILTQSSDWVRRESCRIHSILTLFQSSPNPQTGCDDNHRRRARPARAVSILTQSSDWVRPAIAASDAEAFEVSILTQSSDWVRRRRQPSVRRGYGCFNPHPILRLGATISASAGFRSASTGFNPHPILRLGATSPDAGT